MLRLIAIISTNTFPRITADRVCTRMPLLRDPARLPATGSRYRL